MLSGSSPTLWFVFSPTFLEIHFKFKPKGLLVTNIASICSLDPLFHSDSIIDQVNAEEMDAFQYYSNDFKIKIILYIIIN